MTSGSAVLPSNLRRWIAGTRDLLITAPGPAGPKDHVYAQIFLYHTLTGAMEQLTEDPINKVFAFMWKAPEFDNDDTMFTVINGRQFRIYRKVRRSDSLARWKVVNLIDMPDATPYIVSPEPFVHNGKSWIVFQLSALLTGQSRIGKEMLGPLLIGVLNALAVQALSDKHRRLRRPAVQHGKRLVAKLPQL